jgi:hypothetical protein
VSHHAQRVSRELIHEEYFEKLQLETFDTAFVGPGHLVDSGGLGPCVAVFVYNPQKREAFTGHFAVPSNKSFKQPLRAALSRLGPAKRLEVYVAGGQSGEYSVNDGDPMEETRSFVLETLLELGFKSKRIFIHWTPPDVSGSSLQLNIDSGTVALEYF